MIPYLLGPDEGEKRWGLDGALTRVLATGELTGERLAIIEDLARRGEGTPLHRHAADEETFYVLEGDIDFFLADGQPRRAGPGALVHVPAGEVHAFRIVSETARYLIVTTPHHGRFYHAISDPAVREEMPDAAPLDMERIAAACEAYGVEIVGPPPGVSVD